MTSAVSPEQLALTLPLRITSSGWLEHTPFAMFLIALAQPRTVVELGTYSGSSYCSFCQAVRLTGSDTRCYGVDTWRGDSQAGYFDDKVLQDLQEHHDPLYGSFSQLVQLTFDEALNNFSDASIDLLHIDGHHTYASVKHDFTQWLPKLSERGVVLFHDINVRSGDFGVWKLWEELTPRYRHFEFFHGNGLGILIIGEQIPARFAAWLDTAAADAVSTRNYFAQLGQKVQIIHEMSKLRDEIDQARVVIDNALRTVQARDEQIQRLQEASDNALRTVQARDEQIQRLQEASDAYAREIKTLQVQHAAERAHASDQLSSLRATSAQEATQLLAQVEAWKHRTLTTEQAYEDLRNTRSMRTIARWWKVKAGVEAGLHYPVFRGGQLSHRAALMLRTEGPRAVTRQLVRWLGGERRYYNAAAVARSSSLAEDLLPPTQTSPFDVRSSWSEETLSLRTTHDIPAVAAEALDGTGEARFQAFLNSQQDLYFPNVEQPRVSIVLPVHNKAHLVYLTLANLLATSSATPCEVIVVDDCSTDDTPVLLSRLVNVTVLRNEQNIGFGETCNRGAASARGDFVCFLNSDTLPIPGWLETLTGALVGNATYGAVGAKLIFPDLRLQEAGSILWRDGSALGYGRGAHAFSPAFDYVREVDYCSAACLMVRRTLFARIGGFDARYAPAYYEDADLCMSIREAGYAVAYVPDAVIIHLEHATSGHSRAVELQLKNRDIFVAKWHESLADRGMPTPFGVLYYRDARRSKRILVLDDMIPLIGIGSGFPRTLALLNSLVASGYVVTYVPTTDPRPYEPGTTELQNSGIEVLYGSVNTIDILRERAALYDTVIISRPHNAHLIAFAREANPRATIIYDAEAVFAFRQAQQASITGQPLTAEALLSNVQAELALAADADVVLTVSENERRAIQDAYPALAVSIWGHAIDVQPSNVDFTARQGLVFVGYLASEPNNDAALLLAQKILPQVRRGVACKLTLAGNGASAQLQNEASRQKGVIHLAGFVEDLGLLFEQHRVFVAPHRFAAGIPLKVIEAMAHGIPCVVSDLLAQQLGVTDNCEVLVGSDTEKISDKIIMLHEDEHLWRRIRDNALRFVQEHHDSTAMQQKIATLIESPQGAVTAL